MRVNGALYKCLNFCGCDHESRARGIRECSSTQREISFTVRRVRGLDTETLYPQVKIIGSIKLNSLKDLKVSAWLII